LSLPPAFTRAAFRETAPSIAVQLDGKPVGSMTPTEARGGALGWRLAFTEPAKVAGCTVRVRYTLTATVIGSADAPRPFAPPAAEPPPAVALFPTA
jgi:hypothetical protein